MFRFDRKKTKGSVTAVGTKGLVFRALSVWILIMAVETVHGIVRRLFLEPLTGDIRARQIGVLIGTLLIYSVTYLTIRWLRASQIVHLVAIGCIWVVLTILFEIGLGRLAGLSWDRILSDYDPRSGGLMPFGLIFMFLAPWLTAKQRRIV